MAKALVVDDSRAVRLMMSKILNESGFEVVQAGNGKEAINKMEEHGASIGLVTVDWNMPEMTGLEFVQQLRARPNFADVRVMMVTTENEMNHIIRALQAGANEYVMKPFTREVIEEKLHLLGVLK